MSVLQGCRCSFFLGPRDPITETENGFMEPKYLAEVIVHPLLII